MTEKLIDLYSDTATLPTQEMREFMCVAEVGDEQKGEDPTVTELQNMVAELLGKEAGLFLPSGTMCNQISFAVHCHPGDMVLMDRTAHPLIAEAGGTAVLAGATAYAVDGKKGQFTPEQILDVMEQRNRYKPHFRVVSVEQTTNKPGGRIWPIEQIQAVCEVAHQLGAVTHMDGARLFNASVATGIPLRNYSERFDSVWIDLSKGLGAPVGAVLSGDYGFIEKAWQWKQRIGGGMRQAGIIAAAGIYALRHNVDRLAEDHRFAKRLAEGIADTRGIRIDPEVVETNMVRFDIGGTGMTSTEFQDRLLKEEGVRVSTLGKTLIRAIPHLSVTETEVDIAAVAIQKIAEKFRRN